MAVLTGRAVRPSLDAGRVPLPLAAGRRSSVPAVPVHEDRADVLARTSGPYIPGRRLLK